jgi:tRNA (guanine-N7-)-methyltransferase
MGKNKLKRFAELTTFERVFQPGTSRPEGDHSLRGKWREQVFHNQHPLIVELGCGRGEYTIEMARLFPEINFTGIDKKGARLWRGAKTANEEHLLNAAFLRIEATHLEHYFAPAEINEIWITFPDPQPQKSREKTRMTSPRFLEAYRKLLVTNGVVHLKTDNSPLFEYTLVKAVEAGADILFQTNDLYSAPLPDQLLEIKTTYERRFLAEGLRICYLKFRFTDKETGIAQ